MQNLPFFGIAHERGSGGRGAVTIFPRRGGAPSPPTDENAAIGTINLEKVLRVRKSWLLGAEWAKSGLVANVA